jgi:glycerol-3-phosphate dehydrogenase
MKERQVPQYDVIVIGGGIIGSFVARELSRFEGRFALLDRGPFPGSAVTKAGVSLIHSPLMCPPGTLKGKLCVGAPMRYKKLAENLGAGFREVDELFLALDSSQLANLEVLRKRGEEYGLRQCERIGPEQIRQLEPHVTEKAVGALYVRDLLAVYPPEWAFALCEHARQNGATLFFRTAVKRIVREGDFAYLLQTEKGAFRTKSLVNAAGLYADEIAAMVGDRGIKLTLTKGTMAILDKACSHLVRHTLYGSFSGAHSQLITPTADGNLMIGLGRFPAPADKQDTAVTGEKLREIIAMAKELVPCLPEGEIISTFAGIRSENNRAPGGDFLIAHSPSAPGVVHSLIGSPGLTAAPAVAETVIGMLREAGLVLREKSSFREKREGTFRFSRASVDVRREAVRANPRYGRVVCRCEQVSEGEILDAIQKGEETIDGIKHATRAGMGRCQGGGCTVPVLNLLAGQMGAARDRVTKKGACSCVLAGGRSE